MTGKIIGAMQQNDPKTPKRSEICVLIYAYFKSCTHLIGDHSNKSRVAIGNKSSIRHWWTFELPNHKNQKYESQWPKIYASIVYLFWIDTKKSTFTQGSPTPTFVVQFEYLRKFAVNRLLIPDFNRACRIIRQSPRLLHIKNSNELYIRIFIEFCSMN